VQPMNRNDRRSFLRGLVGIAGREACWAADGIRWRASAASPPCSLSSCR
jgi:hypothetical protein